MSSKLGYQRVDPHHAMQQEMEAGSSFRSPFKMNEKQEETINGLARRFRSLDNSNSNQKFDQS